MTLNVLAGLLKYMKSFIFILRPLLFVYRCFTSLIRWLVLTNVLWKGVRLYQLTCSAQEYDAVVVAVWVFLLTLQRTSFRPAPTSRWTPASVPSTSAASQETWRSYFKHFRSSAESFGTSGQTLFIKVRIDFVYGRRGDLVQPTSVHDAIKLFDGIPTVWNYKQEF